MYRRDLLTAEIQKLAQALARLMGLKLEGKHEEADQGVNELLEQEFDIVLADLAQPDTDNFKRFLTEKDYPAEKLDLLSQILYTKFNPEDQQGEQLALMLKLQLVYHTLEVKHHVINMINIGRQKTIEQYIKQHS